MMMKMRMEKAMALTETLYMCVESMCVGLSVCEGLFLLT